MRKCINMEKNISRKLFILNFCHWVDIIKGETIGMQTTHNVILLLSWSNLIFCPSQRRFLDRLKLQLNRSMLYFWLQGLLSWKVGSAIHIKIINNLYGPQAFQAGFRAYTESWAICIALIFWRIFILRLKNNIPNPSCVYIEFVLRILWAADNLFIIYVRVRLPMRSETDQRVLVQAG